MQSMFLSDLPDSIGLVAGKESPTRARVPVCAWLAALVAWPWLAGVLHAGIAIRVRQFDRLACVDCQAGVVRVWQAVWTNFEVPPARPGLDQTADQNFRNAAKEEGFACGTNSLTTAA